ncbi:MAG: hypothetical protein AAGJ40_24000 [Planctomycetota bacterium]
MANTNATNTDEVEAGFSIVVEPFMDLTHGAERYGPFESTEKTYR